MSLLCGPHLHKGQLNFFLKKHIQQSKYCFNLYTRKTHQLYYTQISLHLNYAVLNRHDVWMNKSPVGLVLMPGMLMQS